jgi:hypothetical protein
MPYKTSQDGVLNDGELTTGSRFRIFQKRPRSAGIFIDYYKMHELSRMLARKEKRIQAFWENLRPD